MPESHNIHESHPHTHGPNCGHTGIQHEGHTDYLHDGHMHHVHEGHVCEHKLSVDTKNPESTDQHNCQDHEREHRHGPGCGHEAVPHGDHTDYLVNDHLHHVEGGQCRNHGAVKRAA
jgi:hypothetical protein